MSTSLAAPPLQSNFIDPPDNPKAPDAVWGLSRVAVNWLLSLTTRIQTSAPLLKAVALTAQTASISSTPIPVSTLSAGLYRVGWTFRITTAASVSSSLSLTIGSTDQTVTCTQVTTAYTGNVTNAPQSGSFWVKSDQAASISYATTYASVGTAMAYKLDLTLEQIS